VARRYVLDGYLPDPDSVRVEEFVNYFNHHYEQPKAGAFAIHLDGSPAPFGGERYWLMRVGLQGRVVAPRRARTRR
jgi:Ca-activated chloride channel family protein